MTDGRTVPQALWLETPYNVFRVDLTEQRARELDALRRNSLRFADICRINYGAQISNKAGVPEEEQFGKERYLATSPEGMVNPKKFYDGDAMRPYGMRWAGVWLDYQPELFYGPRKPALFDNPKISVRYVSGDADTFLAWVDEQERFYTDHLVIHAVPYHLVRDEPTYRVTSEQAERSEHYPLFYLLGVIMSRPVLHYYADLYATGSLQGAFSHVYPDTVKALPIPPLNGRPPDPPEDWWDRAQRVAFGRRALGAKVIGREFRSRTEAAAVITAAAERRQSVEARRDERADDFLAFMDAKSPGWSWPGRTSIEDPPDENVFLRTVGNDIVSIQSINAIRDAFREQTAAAKADLAEARTLQLLIDGLSARLFALAPTS